MLKSYGWVGGWVAYVIIVSAQVPLVLTLGLWTSGLGLTKIQEILLMMGTEIFQFGPGKAEKIGFKDVNLNYKVIVIMDFSKKGRPLQIKFSL